MTEDELLNTTRTVRSLLWSYYVPHNPEVRERAAQLMDRAADLIRERGWGQHDFWKDSEHKLDGFGVPVERRCNLCMLGSIIVARHEIGLEYVVDEAAGSVIKIVLRELKPSTAGSMAGFNDDVTTTANDVLAAFSEVARRLRTPE